MRTQLTGIPIPRPDQVDMVIYHAENDCMDGYASAFAAWKVLGNGAEYVPGV